MDAVVVQDQILKHVMKHSGFEPDRKYIGMSAIAHCARDQYNDYVHGRRVNDQAHLYCYAGYLYENDLRARLTDMGIYKPDSSVELVAPFDERFRGHTDGESAEGELIEIKSINAKGFLLVQEQNRAKPDHYFQVQTYMYFGPWRDALIVYVCRETFEHYVLKIAKSKHVGEQMADKAKYVLAAIDAQQPPQCECGRCRR